MAESVMATLGAKTGLAASHRRLSCCVACDSTVATPGSGGWHVFDVTCLMWKDVGLLWKHDVTLNGIRQFVCEVCCKSALRGSNYLDR